MKRDRFEIKLKQQPGKTVNRLKNMIDKEHTAVVVKNKQFAKILQKKYGIVKEGVKRQVDAFRTIIVHFKNPVGS